MNNRFRITIAVTIAAGLALVSSGCANHATLDNDFESYSVVLEERSGELEILTKAQGWSKFGKKPGYVGFKQGKFGKIVLALNENQQNCATGANWVLTKIELSKLGNPKTEKGRSFGTDQKGWLTQAFPQADEKGVLLDASKNSGTTSFAVTNLNNNNGKQWAYYQVTATRCSDEMPQTVVTDPGWQNGGRKN